MKKDAGTAAQDSGMAIRAEAGGGGAQSSGASASSGSGGHVAATAGSGGNAGGVAASSGAGSNATGAAGSAGISGAGGSAAHSDGAVERIVHVPSSAGCYPLRAQDAAALASLCPQTLCGNGKVDTCQSGQMCSDHGVCYPAMQTEECDDVEQTRSCESLGFVQGQVSCSSVCRLDWSACVACGTDPRIETCVRVDDTQFAETGQTLAVASNGEQAAIVWPVESNTSSLGRLRFALVNDDLSLVTTDCFSDEADNWTPYLAAFDGGWMLAYAVTQPDSSQAVQITLFDANGAVSAKPAPSIAGMPTALIARPGGGPLLLYDGPSGMPGDTASYATAALLDTSGKPMWTKRLADSTDAMDVTAAYTGDGFLWASRPKPGADALVARLELDGTLTTSTLSLGATNFFTQLVWTGTEARLFWEQSFISLDRTGHALGAVRTLIDENASQPRPIQFGARSAVLLVVGLSDPVLGGLFGAASYSGRRVLVTLDENGAAQPPIDIFANGNQGPNFQHQLVVVKDHLLAAFHSRDQRYGHRLYLASIRP